MKFNKQKVDTAIKAVEEMCLHCKNHIDDCPIVKIVGILNDCK
jgi:hypothetical protein